MADLKKELRLIATLDDRAFKTQLQKLKKELGTGLSFKPQDMNELRNAFKGIAKDFTAELKSVISELKAVRGAAPQAGGASSPRGARAGGVVVDAENVTIVNNGGMGGGGGAGGGNRGGNGGLGAFGRRAFGAASSAAFGGYELVQNLREVAAEREFRSLRDQLQGNFIEDVARQSGRNALLPKAVGGGVGFLGGAAAGAALGSFLGPVGTIAGGVIGGVGGALGLGAAASQREGEIQVQRTQVANEAFQRSRNLSGARMQAYAGGGVQPMFMNRALEEGAEFGYQPEDTVKQFLEARGILGNRQALSSMQGLQENQRFLNIGVGEGARNISAIGTASGRGGGYAQRIQEEIVKRGVAAGLDLSKSGQYLRTFSEALTETAGMGRANVTGISEQLSNYAKGFGGGQVTDESLDQARRLLSRINTEGSATEGLAGIGNITGIQKAFAENNQALSPELLLALQNSGPNARPEDIQRILGMGGIQGDQQESLMKSLQENKLTNLQRGSELAGGNGLLSFALRARERGVRSEEELNMENATGTQITPDDLKMFDLYKGQAREALGGKEGQLAISEARAGAQQAIQPLERSVNGITLFDTATSNAAGTLNRLNTALETTITRINNMAKSSGIIRAQ